MAMQKMRRQGQDVMQVNLAGIRRDIVNLAHNYSNAQKAVRKATSNDPWGPSSTLMSEIADFTYNVVAFTEIMQMLWKRLNDHGKNWRHVYKALLLLEYLVKTGSEKVAQQCKENIFAIETLKDFRYMEGCKDQGVNVREKAKNLVALLKDDERLRNERARALKAKERAAQSLSGYGSDGLDTMSPVSSDYQEWEPCTLTESNSRPELEAARPQTVGEEELQLQLALAMSREEAEQEEQRRRSDDVRLQLALSQSQQDFKAPLQQEKQSHMLDLLDVNLGEASNAAAAVVPQTDPWGIPLNAPPAPRIQPQNDPWSIQPAASNGNGNGNISPPMDPWTPVPPQRTRAAVSSPDPFDLEDLSNDLPCNSNTGTSTATGTVKKTPQSFLGENSSLVNLDNLVSASAIKSAASPTPAVTVPFSANPFATTVTTPPAARPTINQIRQDPWAISTTNTTANPFLS